MRASDQPCQDLCTATASVTPVTVSVVGVCDYEVSNPLSDVMVTGCTVQSVQTLPISETDVFVSVDVIVTFTFVESGGTPGSGQCETLIQFSITAAQPPATVSEQLPCTTDLTCTARDAGFEPNLTPEVSAEEFIITITGTVSCTSCLPAVVNVQLCPSAV